MMMCERSGERNATRVGLFEWQRASDALGIGQKSQRDPANNEKIDPVLFNGLRGIVLENNLPNETVHMI